MELTYEQFKNVLSHLRKNKKLVEKLSLNITTLSILLNWEEDIDRTIGLREIFKLLKELFGVDIDLSFFENTEKETKSDQKDNYYEDIDNEISELEFIISLSKKIKG